MYLKVMWHVEEEGITPSSGSLEGLVVPRQHCIFETKRAEYRKIKVFSKTKFHEWLKNCYREHTMMGPEILEEVSETHGMEFLFISIRDEDAENKWRNFVSPNSYLYVMNDQGKTIDTLICH